MPITNKIRKEVIERQGGQCAAKCGRDLLLFARTKAMHKYLAKGRNPVEIDHILPRAQGGGDEKENLQALCGICHGDKTDEERPEWDAPSPSGYLHRITPRQA